MTQKLTLEGGGGSTVKRLIKTNTFGVITDKKLTYKDKIENQPRSKGTRSAHTLAKYSGMG